ncbi:MAG: TIGR00730 family Rossman fold protein [Gammaproteobacteria bacterium]|uniref:LOG family protein n=1 Tax=Rhodoferax sp. TaxID=50421 RepID=UPI001815E48C|nr:TIGR00730 family Rossman fold protein [Rhodoferax sp.]MBU3899627.1 TIGR00730 family Rossman fold protein [Gammaproteobacteria bacterium]MBA3056573.1 TIGR00730 family Rossman fold protein [Rhodoferax sp.]MBU3998958.1 TIGR00730 family Rossman fold protein [Gammaproteobacteria bacterium]MBU4018103.1 TIGR00730 family Rossman fold protein [Gammaproteobacteria bacterium]MBU4080206.1 TIGR00730 family Rossman fold protein [Gammaproteobacteria bacterium]
MDTTQDLSERRLADAWAELQNQSNLGQALEADAYRLAFADPEFLLRRETRGIRFQLEMLKPDLDQAQQGIDSTVVVFGSARSASPETAQISLQQAQISGDAKALMLAQRQLRSAHYYDQARLFARQVANHSAHRRPEERLFIATGGGPGIMEAANRGSHEMGAPSVGLNIALLHEQNPNPYITPTLSFKFHYFALRKMHFMMRAKALVAFPGGFGTLDELFEVITLVQTRKAKPVPIVLFGTDYWKRLVNMEAMVEEGVISVEDLDLFTYVDDAEAAWKVIRDFYKL